MRAEHLGGEQRAAEQAALPALEQQELEARNALVILLGRPPEGFTVAGENLGALMPPQELEAISCGYGMM